MGHLTLGPADIQPLLEGLAIQGTGGGGSPEWGREILERIVRRGRAWNVIEPDDVPDAAPVVSGGIMGSVKTFEAIGFKSWCSAGRPISSCWTRRAPWKHCSSVPWTTWCLSRWAGSTHR